MQIINHDDWHEAMLCCFKTDFYHQSMTDKRCVYSRGTLEFLTDPLHPSPAGTFTTETRS